MKKALSIFMCVVILCSLSACQKVESVMSSLGYESEPINLTEYQSDINSTNIDNNSISNNISSNQSNTTYSSIDSEVTESSKIDEVSSEEDTSSENDNSYKDIECNKIYYFKQIAFSRNDSNKMLFIKFPQEWTLQKETDGYSILKNTQTIGSITTKEKILSDGSSTNHLKTTLTSNNINVTHSIDSITTDNEILYYRTLCYNYTDENENLKNIFITIPYQEIDSSAIYEMITQVQSDLSSTNNNLGLLKLEDSRGRILILGNSFIGSSRIGQTLQTMCGDKMYVEAISRGYAHVGTYTNDPTIMQRIIEGNYSAVFICGLYDQVAVSDLADMIKVCNSSNTKLAVFPAHNENQEKINHAISLYPDAIFLNWKDEINNLINKGIDVSNFCIPDSHKHSTPLAGYVGAHMIYRAIFSEIPQATQFDYVSQEQISLLGDYITTGTIALIESIDAYEIE